MPQVEIKIGGRSFEVACQEGEESFLQSAAALLDAEASSFAAQAGRMPESQLLLMSGLLLADKTVAIEDRLREAEAKIAELELKVANPKEVAIQAYDPLGLQNSTLQHRATQPPIAGTILHPPDRPLQTNDPRF